MICVVLKNPQAPCADPNLQVCLGAVIRRLRHDLGITQEELAWRADTHRTYIADVERGARNVTLRVIANLAKALEIRIDRLFSAVSAAVEAPSLNGMATKRQGRVAGARSPKLHSLPDAASSLSVRPRRTQPKRGRR